MQESNVFKSTQSSVLLFLDPDGCGNNPINLLQLLLQHRHPSPPPWWFSDISDIIESVNQFLVSSLVTNDVLAQQVKGEAVDKLRAATEKFASSVKAKTAVAA